MSLVAAFIRKYWHIGIIAFVILLFFYKTFLKGYIPFPGDLLLAEYNPWRHTSYAGYVPGSVPNKGQYFDVIRELYPWKTLVIDSLQKGIIPLWNPYSFSGSPLLANYQSQVFYPLGILYLALPQVTAWTMLVILQLVLGSLGTYVYAKSLKLTRGASVLAALLFNFSGFATVWIEFNTVWHTILWVPWILYIVEVRIKKPLTVFQKFLGIFAIFSSLTAGHPQDFINCMLFVFVYTLLRLLHEKSEHKKILPIALDMGFIAGIPLLLGMAQLLPTYELYKNSARVPHDIQFVLQNMLIQPWQLPLSFMSDFFGNPATKSYVLSDTYVNKTFSVGVVGLLLAVVTLFNKKNIQTRIFIFIAACMLLVDTNNPFTQIFYTYPLPFLSTGTPTRNLFIYIFCISLLSAYGFDQLRSQFRIRWSIVTLTGIFILVGALYIVRPPFFHAFETITLSSMKKAYLLSGVLFALGAFAMICATKIPRLRYVLLLLVVGELFYGFTKFNPFVPSSFVFPQNDIFTFLQKNAGVDRFWGYGTAHVDANFAAQYHLYSADGTDPLNLRWYNGFVQATNDGKIPDTFTRITRSDAYIKPGYGADDFPDNIYRQKILQALGVRYILDRSDNPKGNDTFPPSNFKPVYNKDDWTIYEYKQAAPRFFLTHNILYYKSREEFEKLFFSPSFDPSKTVLLESPRTPLQLKPAKDSSVQLVSYETNGITLSTQSDAPQLLYISDTYDTGWVGFIDNHPTEILKANYALRAIYVPQGKHTIAMKYQPSSFKTGVLLSFAGLLVLVFYIGIQKKIAYPNA